MIVKSFRVGSRPYQRGGEFAIWTFCGGRREGMLVSVATFLTSATSSMNNLIRDAVNDAIPSVYLLEDSDREYIAEAVVGAAISGDYRKSR